jgi:hypothetical protein
MSYIKYNERNTQGGDIVRAYVKKHVYNEPIAELVTAAFDGSFNIVESGTDPDLWTWLQSNTIKEANVALDSSESELARVKAEKIEQLKLESREQLENAIGDTKDNCADIHKLAVLGEAIRLGFCTDQDIIDRYEAHIQNAYTQVYNSLDEFLIGTLEFNETYLKGILTDKYYTKKAMVDAATTIEAVRAITL